MRNAHAAPRTSNKRQQVARVTATITVTVTVTVTGAAVGGAHKSRRNRRRGATLAAAAAAPGNSKSDESSNNHGRSRDVATNGAYSTRTDGPEVVECGKDWTADRQL